LVTATAKSPQPEIKELQIKYNTSAKENARLRAAHDNDITELPKQLNAALKRGADGRRRRPIMPIQIAMAPPKQLSEVPREELKHGNSKAGESWSENSGDIKKRMAEDGE
jgi:phosphoenolpyruvate-protein kinase (PTS system EI component)